MKTNGILSQEERAELERRIGAELAKIAEEMDIQKLREWIAKVDGTMTDKEKASIERIWQNLMLIIHSKKS